MGVTRASLQPISVGRCVLRNRVAFAATVNNLGTNTALTDDQIAFYAERSEGGVGMVITEGLSVHPTSSPNSTVPFAFDASLVGDFKRLADAVHAGGAAMIGQLWHVGRQALWNPSLVPWGPSAERDPYSGATPHVMNDAEVLDVIEGFVTSACNLAEAGFDGVELHGAHGYLITQFLSPWSNRRDDRWGGTVENRARLVVEIVRRIREAVRRDFVIGLKLSVHEFVDGGLDLDATKEIVGHLAATAAPDYFAASQGNFSPSLETHVPDLRFADAQFSYLARGVREASAGEPVMTVGKIPDVDTADWLVADGAADLVGMSRALLADPHLVRKVRAGGSPRPCIYCNVCWEYIHTGRPVACIYEPRTGQESRVGTPEPVPRDRSRSVDVVGGGPAGLEFARVAVQLGHSVHLHERAPVVGGRLASEASRAGRACYQAAVNWLRDEIVAGGGRITVNDEVAPGAESELGGDVVVLATGASPIVEPLPGVDAISLEEALANVSALADPVVVVDEMESEPLYSAIEDFVAAGHAVTLVTRRAAIGRRVAYVSLIGVLRRLDDAGVVIHTLLVPRRADDGMLIAAHVYSGHVRVIGRVGTLVRAGPYRARTVDGNDVSHVIGDAYAPREVLAVVREASARAREILSLSAHDGIGS